jgi:hypothetical protein
MNTKKFKLLSRDYEGGKWYILKEGTYEDCLNYRTMYEAEQDKLGICVDCKMSEVR